MGRPPFAHATTLLLGMTIASCGGPRLAADRPTASGSDRAAASTAISTESDSCVRGVADVSTFRGGAARTGRMPGPSLTGSVVLEWTFAADGPLTSSPVIIDGVVFQGSASGTLYAIDLESGELRWSVDLGAAVSSPTGINGLVVVGLTSGRVAAVNRADGSVKWTRMVGGELLGGAAFADGSLLVASTTGAIEAIEPSTGVVRWQSRVDGRIARSPAVEGDVVVVPVEPGAIAALNANTGRTMWQTEIAGGGGVGTPTIANDLVLAAAGLDDAAPGERAIVALDLKSGAIVWRWSSKGYDRVYSPAVSSGRAIVVDEGAGVTALDVYTGRDLWRVSRDAPLEANASTAGDSVLVVSNRGKAASLDVATGAVQWEVPFKGVPYGPVVSCGWVIVPSNLGTLIALRVSS